MKMNAMVFAAFLACAMAVLSADRAGAQSLFDEMLVDGETVSADSVADAKAKAEAEEVKAQAEQRRMKVMRARALRAKRAAMRRAGTDSPLWDLTDAEGEPLDPDQFGPQVLVPDSTLYVDDLILPPLSFMPLIFNDYSMEVANSRPNPLDWSAQPPVEMDWSERAVYRDTRNRWFIQHFMVENPGLVRYNIRNMPRPPKEFHMETDPSQAKINVTEIYHDRKEMAGVAKPLELEHIHWLQNFDGSLQFSQAYISPNWYQGGNSNLNSILNILYEVKLNPAFHPNLIFETSIQYKLGINNAPDDTVHAYNISEDVLQINTKFGVKAIKRWYYSLTAQFKTQVLNNYKTNSEELASAFLSPGELNLGVGMTYSYENPRKTLNFAAAISPLSYNLKTCTNSRLNPTSFGIEEGRKSISEYGSSAELTFKWKLAYNIEYFSRLFLFTNYEYAQGDWENTITFTINRFLSTKLAGHLRYQSDALPMEDTRWHQWQLKEVLSIGFAYKFSRQ